MATKNVLPTNYQDDVMATNMGGKRRYNLINNPDGTVSLEDVTEYTQVGSDFNAKSINATNTAINACYSSTEVDNKLSTKVNTSSIVNNASTLLTATNTSQVAGAVGIKGLKDYIPTNQITTYSGNLNNLETGMFKCALGSCSNYPSNIPKSTVTVLSYKNALQMIVPSDSNDYTAYRRYDGGWQKWVVEGASCSFNDAYKGGLLKDALAVDLTNPYGTANKTARVDRADGINGSYNLPPSCQFGVREVTWIATNWVIVRITGVDTRSIPRIWVTEYNSGNGAWNGWSMITQGLDRGPVQNIYAGHWEFTIEPSTTRFLFMSNSAIKDLLQVKTDITQKNTAVFIASAGGFVLPKNDDDQLAGGNYSVLNTNLKLYYMSGGWYCELDPVAVTGSSSMKRLVDIDWLIVHWGNYNGIGANGGIGVG